jgi:hypothetical protein
LDFHLVEVCPAEIFHGSIRIEIKREDVALHKVGVEVFSLEFLNGAAVHIAADVRTAATSGVGSLGVAEGPQAATNIVMKIVMVKSLGFMQPP